MFRKCQTATEYLILLAVVIVIAMIVISVLGGIPSIGGGAISSADEARLKSLGIGVENYAFSNESGVITLKNNNPDSVSVSAVYVDGKECGYGSFTLRAGQSQKINCSNITNAGKKFDYAVSMNWTDVNSGAKYVQADSDVKISGTVVSGLDTNVGSIGSSGSGSGGGSPPASPFTLSFASPTPNDVLSSSSNSYVFNVSSSEDLNSCDLFIDLNYGDGSDGDIVVSSADTVVNSYTYLTGNESDLVISVADATSFNAGDEILIHQVQNYSGGIAGQYEFAIINSKSGNDLTLDNLTNSYYSVTHNVIGATTTQIVKVPHYNSVTVNSDSSIIAKAWDGFSGGIVVFRSATTLTVNGNVSSSGKGYRGGLVASYEGYQGESYNGNGSYANYNYNLGAGGAGRNAVMYADSSRHGGGAGYKIAGDAGSPYNSGNTGRGGSLYGASSLDNLLFGSGGGAGGGSGAGGFGGPGGAGAGAVLLFSNSIVGSGNVSASGTDGGVGGTGGGGAGSGGSVYLNARSVDVSSLILNVSGATGGSGTQYGGKGGDSSAGYVRVDYRSVVGSLSVDSNTNSSKEYSMSVDSGLQFATYSWGSVVDNSYSYYVNCSSAGSDVNVTSTRSLYVE